MFITCLSLSNILVSGIWHLGVGGTIWVLWVVGFRPDAGGQSFCFPRAGREDPGQANGYIATAFYAFCIGAIALIISMGLYFLLLLWVEMQKILRLLEWP